MTNINCMGCPNMIQESNTGIWICSLTHEPLPKIDVKKGNDTGIKYVPSSGRCAINLTEKDNT